MFTPAMKLRKVKKNHLGQKVMFGIFFEAYEKIVNSEIGKRQLKIQ